MLVMAAQIERLTSENCTAAYKVQVGCHAFPWSSNVFENSLSAPYFAYQWVAESDTLGYFIALQVADESTLMDIGVKQTYRQQGIGEKLLQFFLAKCREKNSHQVWLEVRASNQAAIGLYQKYGFQIVERRKHYYPAVEADEREDALIMLHALMPQAEG